MGRKRNKNGKKIIESKYEASVINTLLGIKKSVGDTVTKDDLNKFNKKRIINILSSNFKNNKKALSIRTKADYLYHLNMFYDGNNMVSQVENLKNEYGFKNLTSMVTALTLYGNKKEIQERYFSEFYDKEQNEIIHKLVGEQKLNQHCKMKDILLQYFTEDRILKFIVEKKSNGNYPTKIERNIIAIENLFIKNEINDYKPIKSLMEDYNATSYLDLINKIPVHKQNQQVEINNPINNDNNPWAASTSNNPRDFIDNHKDASTSNSPADVDNKQRNANDIPSEQEILNAVLHDIKQLYHNDNQLQSVTNETPSTNNSQLDLINNDNNPWAASTSNNPLDTYNLPLNAATSDNPQDFTITNYPQRVAAPDSILPYVEGTNINQMPQTQPGQVSYQPVYSLQGQPVFYGQLNTYNNYLNDQNTGNPVNVEPGIYDYIGNDVNGNAIYVKQPNDQSNIQQNTQSVLPGEQISTYYTNTVNHIDATNNFVNEQQARENNGQNMGPYYNSNQKNFMNYNNHQGF